jgi:signal peptidase I
MNIAMQDAHKAEYDVASVKPKSRVKLVVLLVVGLIIVPPILYVAFMIFVAQPVKVVGAAMSPTLNEGDRIFIWKRFSSLKRGDIVLYFFPLDHSQRFIKRVVGLPGETIDMDLDGRITINGRPVEEPYVQPYRNEAALARWRNMSAEFKRISPDSYFVMGDNRDVSNDSRTWGAVPKSLIYGKFMSRYWPLRAVN